MDDRGGSYSGKGRAPLSALMLDFGGVLADEGFREGLKAIAKKNGVDEHLFVEIVHKSGYVTGRAAERDFWRMLRDSIPISGTEESLRNEILSRFRLRPWLLDIVKGLREKGTTVSLLTDQTDWLYRLDERDNFLRYFDFVFNSYDIGKTKRERDLFLLVLGIMKRQPREVLFVDDNEGNISIALALGIETILFTGKDDFLERMKSYFFEK